MDFPAFLKQLRKASGYSQRTVAELLGMDRSTYAYYETGKTEPSIRNIKKLAALYGQRLEDFLNCRFTVSDFPLSSPTPEESIEAFLEVFRKLSPKEQQLVMLYRSCRNKEAFLRYIRNFEEPDDMESIDDIFEY